MDIDESRRSCAKRPRTVAAFGTMTPAEADGPTSTVFGSSPMTTQQSIESLLSIPVAVIFRTCSSQEGRPLLTRAEAECFLQISCLAQELDILTGSSEAIFLQQRYYIQYTQDLLLSSSPSSSSSQPQLSSSQTNDESRNTKIYLLNPMLRPLLPILNFLRDNSAPILQQIHQTLSHLSADLIGCSSILRQSAEQNWTMADALDAMQQDDYHSEVQGPALSDEKRKVADLEEELCQRIERVLGMSSLQVENAGGAEKSSSFAKLSQSSEDRRYRRKLFAESDDQEDEAGDDNQGDPQAQAPVQRDLSQQHSDDNEKHRTDQQYALDLKPISEYCSELFEDAVHAGCSREETLDDENGDGANNSNDNGTDEGMNGDESQQGGREENGDGDVFKDSSENGDNRRQSDSVAENGEMKLDPVETTAESQTRNHSSRYGQREVGNDRDFDATDYVNKSNEDTEQTTEIENELLESTSNDEGVDDRTAIAVDEEVEEYPPSQETDLRSGLSRESPGNSFYLQKIPPNENEKHPLILVATITSQPEGSSFPLTAEDDIEEDDDDNGALDKIRSERPVCSQRTSSAAEALAILGIVSRFTANDVGLY